MLPMANSGCQVSLVACVRVRGIIPSAFSFPQERERVRYDAAPARCERMTYAVMSSTRNFTDLNRNKRPTIIIYCRMCTFSRVCHDYLPGYTCTMHVSVCPCMPVSTETSMKCTEWHAGICVLLWIPDSCMCVCMFVCEVPCYPPELLIKGLSGVSVTELKAGERNFSILN